MSFNAAALRMMADKGLSSHDIAEIAAANEGGTDTAAEKRRAWDRERKREKREAALASTGHSTGNPPDPAPNEIDNLTPTHERKTEAKASSKSSDQQSEPQPWALPAGVSLQVWTDLKTNRKRKRLGNTETAWKAFLDDLKRVASQTGIPPPQLIEMCTAKGWGAIYDPREERHGSQSQSSLRGPRPDPTLELVRAATEAQRQDRGDHGEARLALPAGKFG